MDQYRAVRRIDTPIELIAQRDLNVVTDMRAEGRTVVGHGHHQVRRRCRRRRARPAARYAGEAAARGEEQRTNENKGSHDANDARATDLFLGLTPASPLLLFQDALRLSLDPTAVGIVVRGHPVADQSDAPEEDREDRPEEAPIAEVPDPDQP